MSTVKGCITYTMTWRNISVWFPTFMYGSCQANSHYRPLVGPAFLVGTSYVHEKQWWVFTCCVGTSMLKVFFPGVLLGPHMFTDGVVQGSDILVPMCRKTSSAAVCKTRSDTSLIVFVTNAIMSQRQNHGCEDCRWWQ
jgi:hypothetical protein